MFFVLVCTAICRYDCNCENGGGTCILPGICTCNSGWSGSYCKTRTYIPWHFLCFMGTRLHIQWRVTLSPGPSPSRRGLVLTACACGILSVKKFVHLCCSYVEDYTRAFFEIDSSSDLLYRILLEYYFTAFAVDHRSEAWKGIFTASELPVINCKSCVNFFVPWSSLHILVCG